MERRFFLSQVTVFKNEAHALEEFISHYISQGVEHFWLIDNGSTDCFAHVLPRYSGLYTLFSQPKAGKIQTASYKKFVLPLARNLTEWLLVVDVDEFVYSRGHATVAAVLKLQARQLRGVLQICMPWKVFGTNGFKNQPKCLVKSLTKRFHYGPSEFKKFKRQVYHHANLYIGKCILNMRHASRIMIHAHDGGGSTVCSDLTKVPKLGRKCQKKGAQQCMQALFHQCLAVPIPQQLLHVNHYKFQSEKFMLEVKGKRGRADGNRNFGPVGEYRQLNGITNAVHDDELQRLNLTTCTSTGTKQLHLDCGSERALESYLRED